MSIVGVRFAHGVHKASGTYFVTEHVSDTFLEWDHGLESMECDRSGIGSKLYTVGSSEW